MIWMINNTANQIINQSKVFIDRGGEDGRRRHKDVAADSVQLRLGNLAVNNLGNIVNESDSKEVRVCVLVRVCV